MVLVYSFVRKHFNVVAAAVLLLLLEYTHQAYDAHRGLYLHVPLGSRSYSSCVLST